ncbi:hypothetical protein GA830_17235 [Mesorhizobium sp. NBSH29]|uniref:CorA family divalent cation transporter n=1 Tax=Mesorhizobium sp. NBSH29 TaxID=2654249 RepID=UPI0018968E9A|nr:CorA family divalent cation transporter [Mesorhizobium sp. NBSH29]QPC88305.1 hypothetical protein GA830_17235 [Mesorhizobium sp. NBSH29]
MQDISHLPLLAAANQAPGLVFAYRLHPDSSRAESLAASAIPDALAAQHGWVWLHVDLLDQRTPGWINKICALPPCARMVFEGHVSSLALAHEDGVVHGVMADLHGELARQSTRIGRLHFSVSEHLLVTGRRHPLQAVEEVHTAVAKGASTPPTNAFGLLEIIVAAFCRNTGQRLATATIVLDEVEDHLVTERLSDERANLKDVRRLAVSLHRPIGALAELFKEEDRAGWALGKNGHQALERIALRLNRLDQEVVTVNDRARLLQEEVAAELADESNRSLRALALISALLLPGTLIAGIFGMNTGGLPLAHAASGFLIAMLIGIGATAIFYGLLKRAGANLRF